MRRHLLTTAILLGLIAMPHLSDASPLDRYKWKNRLLIVTGPDDAAAQQQRRIYDAARAGMSERAIVLLDAVDESAASRELRAALGAEGRRFKVYLIGKDGHTAFASDTPVSADALFKRVDAMPMRQDEMRRDRPR
ncbi:DUF4174 domain-containing protein [Bradyrhizobium sp. 83012]|uniref:DUF4174 domain-containing protein n=1 Tax=Bradyrhizobium aeschynomenes TaxID=2734909 RepID=A0ABX2C5U0_9BRAD|nr:DUF4174 domain-containing protein [Bradyrhizobium aeschynomenes]NPU13122.1 DUF4174 domain-containing protein [Bradyrhizobium aeschynomenes]NPU63663.1 DUF4174 domain-containing protein [Bradyrhizobium aeschynomenes]NPV19336.1 DUF4174 domain-containing protein [Bradyrhizobium aeschynomenes]